MPLNDIYGGYGGSQVILFVCMAICCFYFLIDNVNYIYMASPGCLISFSRVVVELMVATHAGLVVQGRSLVYSLYISIFPIFSVMNG